MFLAASTLLAVGETAGETQTGGEGAWEMGGALSVPRYDHPLTLLADGTVLAAGGRTVAPHPVAAVASAEVFFTKEGTWGATGGLRDARWRHTATLLRDGGVLVAGGFTLPTTTANAQPVLDTAESYDPATGTWAAAQPMVTRRALHAATLLADGRVVVAGGRTCDAPPPVACNFSFRTDSVEIFRPGHGDMGARRPPAGGPPHHSGDPPPGRDGAGPRRLHVVGERRHRRRLRPRHAAVVGDTHAQRASSAAGLDAASRRKGAGRRGVPGRGHR